MKTVLFAVDRMMPNPKALEYAMTLCRRMLASLDVLHIIQSPDSRGGYLKTLKSSILQARDAFENTMVSATFAEAGVPDPISALKKAAYDEFQRALPVKPDTGIDYHCVVTGEGSGTIIERYVHRHRNVVLTVFDPRVPVSASGRTRFKGRLEKHRVMPNLAIPLVLVKNGQ